MIIADSSVWIDYFNGVESREADFLDDLLRRDFILMGDLILVEVLQGFDRDTDFRRAQALFDRLDCAEMAGYELALKSARNYRRLRQRGITVRKTIDVLIATFCIEHGHVLLHADRDFERMREPLGLVTI
jgi:predicted nucleic acid-binding protein